MFKFALYMNTNLQTVRKQLRAKGWSKSEVEEALETIRQQRRIGQQNYRNALALKKSWKELMDDLVVEQRIARSQRYYWTPDRSMAHHQFYRRYLVILKRVADIITSELSLRIEAPRSIAQQLGLPNNGEHWTDWVDWAGTRFNPPVQGLTDLIKEDYDALEFNPRRKRKAILSRTKASNEQLLERVRRRTVGQLQSLERLNAISPDSVREKHMARMYEALRAMDEFELHEKPPTTWRGFLAD